MTEEITYLIANYNNGCYIPDTIRSLTQQTDNRWKAMICDDGSSDDSISIITPLLNDRMTLLVNKKNIGYIRTLKRLIDAADTDIVAILDADDALYPEATEAILQTYADHPGCGFVYSRYRLFDETLTYPAGIGTRPVPAGHTSLRYGFIGHIKAFRRSVYALTDGLDDTMLHAEDRDLVYKLEEVTKPVFIDQILYTYRIRWNSAFHAPQNTEIALRNHRRAQRQAVQRRQIQGMPKLIYELYFLAWYLRMTDRYTRFAHLPAALISKTITALDRCFDIRSDGQLRRAERRKRP